MTTESENNASLSRQLAEAEAETARLRKLLSTEATKAAAWMAARELGALAPIVVPLILERCRATIDDAGVRVEVIGDEGRPRFVFRGSEAKPMTAADLLAELNGRPEIRRILADQGGTGEKPAAKAAEPRNLTAESRRLARQTKTKANDELRSSCLAKNPFAPPNFNLTQQTRLAKADPELAARLQREAAA